jgi:uncharacterized membrane protein
MRYYFARGAFILFLGIFIDVVAWGILPLTTVDVLYLLGLGLPIAAALLRSKSRVLLGVVAVILVATPILQEKFGYADYPNEWMLSGKLENAANTPVIQHWFIDGWFPLFPWLSYLIVGAVVGKWRWAKGEQWTFRDRTFVLPALGLLLIGAVLWWFDPGKMLSRHGFSELFYPPTVGFVLFSWGTVGMILLFMDMVKAPAFLTLLGQCSMLMYVAHALVIGKAYSDYWENKASEERFLLLYFVLMVVLIAIAWSAKWLKRRWSPMPWWSHWILGG